LGDCRTLDELRVEELQNVMYDAHDAMVQMLPAAVAPPTQYDVNESTRANEIRSCLRSRRYVAKPFYESPKAIPQHWPERKEFIG
jgi:hypothetical protein